MATITPQQAVDILETRNLALRPIRRKTGARAWAVLTAKGERLPGFEPADTALDAVELAETILAERDAREQDRRAERILTWQQQGTYYHRPRTETQDDGAGGTIEVLVFDIHAADGTVTEHVGFVAVKGAWLALAAALMGEGGGGGGA